MQTSEIKSTKAQVAGNFSSVVKSENIDTVMHKFLTVLGYKFTSQLAYKAVEESTWKGIPTHARLTIIENMDKNNTLSLIASEFNLAHISRDRAIELINDEKNVEKLTRLLNIA
jgi:hypothetical protein